MTITLQYQSTTLQLDPDLYWSDENWTPVEQTQQRTVTGALILSHSARIGGRPFTLEPIDDQTAWMPRSLLDTLRSWAAVAGREMTLTLRGQSYTVVFRHSDTAIEASPVFHFSDTDPGDWYRVTLRFLEV